MRTARWIAAGLTGVVLVLLSSPAHADIGPPVKIRMPRTTRQAVSGEVYRGTFEIHVAEAGLVTDIQVQGPGWAIQSVDRPAGAVAAVPARPLRIPFRAIPADADQAITISLMYDGRAVTRSYRVGPEAFAEARKDRPAIQVEPGTPLPARPAGGRDIRAQGPVTLRFTGRIAYARPTGVDNDGVPIGATSIEGVDGIWVQVMDQDDFFDEVIWSGYTDRNGYFDTGNILWDDCDILGCDDPDIYIRWECDTPVVNVQDAGNIFEPDYSWSNVEHVIDDFTGSFHDFGTWQPANVSQMPALHIHNSIVRAHRYILNKSGTGISVAEVDVLWPDGDNAYYSPYWNEIHISTRRQWNEGTHVHEYGHHFLELYSASTTPNYCNGFCDDDPPDACGHCVWCRETDHDAWNEGWPNWLADVVTRDFLLEYQFSNGSPWMALFPRSQENIGLCPEDNMLHDPFLTEGFVGALLRDIEDDTNDNHFEDPAPDCYVDAMSLGPQEIFQIVVQDKPTTVQQFINIFWDRFSEHQQDFWSTAANVSPLYIQDLVLPVPQVTNITPTCVTYRQGDRVELQVQGNGSLLQYQWRRNLVDLADGGRISGANEPTLVIDSVQVSDGAVYTCLVSTCDGTLSYPSMPIRVHVFPTPAAGMAALGFGRNVTGQLGQGHACEFCAWSPAPVADLANFTDIGPNRWHTVAVLTDGSVWGWGDNAYGAAVGREMATRYLLTPELVTEVTDAVMAKAGEYHSLVLQADGKVWAWGYNGYHSLGVPNAGQFQPIEVPGVGCMVAVGAGSYHSLALSSDGSVWAWGRNGDGELGRGYFGGWDATATPVTGLNDVTAIAAGGFHTLALKSDGTVWAWGWNSQGQLGDGTLNSRSSPNQVPGIAGATAVAAGFDHSMALLADGSVRVWGGGNGKMGNGTPSRSLVPITPIGMNADVIGIAGGYYHSLFLKSDRKVWGCGLNTNGQLGFETYQLRHTPVELPGLADIRRIIVGHTAENTFALAPGVPPTFSLVLGSETATVGDLLIWTTVVNGTPPLTFEWRLDGAVLSNGGSISGATSSVLTINPVLPEHEGEYTCTVTNPYGTDSITRTLTVNCIQADFNCDGYVDDNDLALLANCVAGPQVFVPPPGCTLEQFAAADADGDGDVDQDDFGRFQRCFAGPDQLPTPGCGQ